MSAGPAGGGGAPPPIIGPMGPIGGGGGGSTGTILRDWMKRERTTGCGACE